MSAARLNAATLGQRVYAYKNLTRGCWSLKALDGASKGKVVAHLDALQLTDCQAKVSAAQLRWMREHGKRLVCAGIVGTLAAFEAAPMRGVRISFRPFDRDAFHWTDTGEDFTSADRMSFDQDGAWTA
jgi:hypothetical protein